MPKMTEIEKKVKDTRQFREKIQQTLRSEADRLEREAAQLREIAMTPKTSGESE